MNANFNQKLFNTSVSHPLQSFEWGEFREKTGISVIRKFLTDKKDICFQLTIHKIPHTPWTIGYFPKGNLPTKEVIDELIKIGKEQNCIFIQLEPNIQKIENLKFQIENLDLVPAAHPLFTKYTFILDLTKPEEELLKNMHSKTRYNIKVAQKHGVKIIEDNSDKAFETYLSLMKETTNRQKFYAHSDQYHKTLWKTLKTQNSNNNNLNAHIFLAKYNEKTLAAWMLFVFHDTLYYPYGASSNEHRETMASNLMMWEAIKFGKKMGLRKFDMWGALGSNADKNDPWYGFHRFKQGYGPTHTEFIGSYDLVINTFYYQVYKIIDKLRWIFLRLKKW